MRGVEGLARFLRRVRPLPPLAGGGWEGGNAQIASLAGFPPPNPPPQAGVRAGCPPDASPPLGPPPASRGGQRAGSAPPPANPPGVQRPRVSATPRWATARERGREWALHLATS